MHHSRALNYSLHTRSGAHDEPARCVRARARTRAPRAITPRAMHSWKGQGFFLFSSLLSLSDARLLPRFSALLRGIGPRQKCAVGDELCVDCGCLPKPFRSIFGLTRYAPQPSSSSLASCRWSGFSTVSTCSCRQRVAATCIAVMPAWRIFLAAHLRSHLQASPSHSRAATCQLAITT